MRIPTQMQLGGVTWAIVEDNDGLKDTDRYGETRYLKDEIALDTRGRTAQRVRRTLLHEIIHAADSLYSINEDSLSEAKVKALGAALFDVMAGNPELIDFIMGRNDNDC